MADLASIGPVSIARPMLWDDNSFSVSSGARVTQAHGASIFQKGQFTQEESFSIVTSIEQALQLKGLVELGEPVWINSSTDLGDNDHFQHKGWYLLTNIDFEYLNPALIQNSIDCILISTHAAEYLTLDYSKGYYDGLALDYTYQPTTNVYQLQDDCSGVTNWNSVIDAYVTSPAGASDGAEIYLTAANSRGDGYYGGGSAWMRSLVKYTPPFTIETVMDRRTLPASGANPASIAFGMSKEVMPADSLTAVYKSFGQWFYAQWMVSNGATALELATSRNGSWNQMYPWTSQGTTYDELGLKIELTANGTMTVYTDLDTTGTWSKIYSGPINIDNLSQGLYLYLYVYNADLTNYTGSFHKVDVYNADALAPEYVVCAPYNATVQTTATGNRVGESGNIPYYTSPTGKLRYQIAQADMYKGAVQLRSTNNTGADDLQVFHTDARLTPTTTTLKNAFTKLTFDADEMILSGYDSAAWQEINKFDFGTAITILKPLKITHDDVVLQVNDTKVHMTRSSPMISLYHPNTAVAYVVKDNFYYNGALDTSIAGGDTIAMTDLDDGYYSYCYADAPADVYRTIFGKKDPTSILSDSLPADDITGIGWNQATMEGAGGINTAASLVRQWWKQTRTGVSMKQII